MLAYLFFSVCLKYCIW